MVVEKGKIKKIIVGLGNPGPDYSGTRHNLGWTSLDYFLNEISLKKDFHAHKRSCQQVIDVNGISVLLVKPTTYMNLSGEAVKPLLETHQLTISDLLVVHDDMDLEPGRAKIRVGGGAGGHKGVLSIMEHCGEDFARMKIGIGRPENFTDDDDIDWVLTAPDGDEAEMISAALPVIAQGILVWIEEGAERAMNVFNTVMREIFSGVESDESSRKTEGGENG